MGVKGVVAALARPTPAFNQVSLIFNQALPAHPGPMPMSHGGCSCRLCLGAELPAALAGGTEGTWLECHTAHALSFQQEGFTPPCFPPQPPQGLCGLQSL